MRPFYICDQAHVDSASELCRAAGWGIEVQAFYDPAVGENQQEVERHRLAASGIRQVAVHGPFGDLCAGSFDAMVRQVTRHRFDLAYEVACQIEATDIVLHHGYVPGTSPPDRWVPRFVEFWDAFSQDKSGSVRFHLENMLERGPEVLLAVLEAIPQDNVDACLDIGHAHCNSQTTLGRWIEILGDRIGYVHLHDNHGQADEHLALGEGDIPLFEVCESLLELSPSALWALECAADGREQSVAWLREHGFLAGPHEEPMDAGEA